ncbi:MAG: domain S-box [Firmicutes bacterium]|nr:domain S-box [Bacillota bacterium]
MTDSSGRKDDLNYKDNNLHLHKSIFDIYDHPNIDIFFNAYRHADIVMSILNLDDFTYVDVNDSWIKAFGYSRQEVISQRYSALPLWIDAVQGDQKYQEIKQNNGMHSFEVEYFSKDGKIGYGMVSSQLITIDGHQFCLNAMIDITDRKQTENKLHKSEENLKNILFTLASISDPFYAVDAEWRIVYVNQKAQEWLQRDQEELCGKLLWEILREPEKPRICKQICIAMRERITVNYETFSVKMASWFEVSVYPAREGGLSFYFKDITARKKAERALKESEERHRLLAEKLREVDLVQSEDRFYKIFNLNPDMIAIINMKDDTYIEINQAALDVYGFTREEVIGRNAVQIMTIEPDNSSYHHFIEQLKLVGIVKNFELTTRSKTGKIIKIMISSVLINLDGKQCRLSILKDISERKRYEKEIARLDRLNLVGKMAASIGHEIRNPMTSVRGFLQMFSAQENSEEKKIYYDLMIEELDRANAIITEFLNLAKDKTADLRPQSLGLIIARIRPMIEAEALMRDKHVRIIEGNDIQLLLDENEIRQMVLNLVRNGLDAMSSGGTVTIITEETEREVILCIADQGCGIDSDIIELIGTPFVSSKDNGVGLGMAVCYSIAARHGARIEFETGSEGTAFRIYFPKIL